MRSVRLSGGLGNQLFQYAYARAINAKINKSKYSWLNAAYLRGNPINRYGLDKYNIKLKIESIFSRICRNILRIPVINENGNSYGKFNPQLLKLPKSAYIKGLFQTEKYFKNIRHELLSDLTIKASLNVANQDMLDKILSEKNATSLHIRRGDYLWFPEKHNILPLDYYKKAVKYIANKVSSPHFFIFSDDVNWVLANLKLNHPYTVVNINNKTTDGYLDLNLMRFCQHNIIANSTFSWWGAWMNDNKDKIVIAPSVWVSSKADVSDIVPDEWVRL